MRKGLGLFVLLLSFVFIISACSGQTENNDLGAQPGNNIEAPGNNTEQPADNEGDTDLPEDSDMPGDVDLPDDSELPGDADLPGDSDLPDDGDVEQPDESGPADETEKPGDEDGEMTPLEEIVALILEAVEQRPTMVLEPEMVKDWYHLDTELLAEYAIHVPMFNISTNEFAVLRVKDVNDIAAVKEGVEQRALDVQKSFEQYLPDQYKNAQNYKLVTSGDYMLFVIDDEDTAQAIVQLFENYFTE